MAQPLTIAAYNQSEATFLATTESQLGAQGDRIDLVSQKGDVPALNRLLNTFPASLPVRYVAHVAGLDNVRSVLGSTNPALDSRFSGIFYDYEPNYEPEFDFDPGRTYANFTQFAAICHQHGKLAIGYPSGQGLKRGWDYGRLATVVDELAVQTQHAGLETATWEDCIERLVRQFQQNGVPLSRLTVQTSLPQVGVNSTTPQQALVNYQYAQSRGVSSFNVWWSPKDPGSLTEFLKLIGR
jgi:hypothetical protein